MGTSVLLLRVAVLPLEIPDRIRTCVSRTERRTSSPLDDGDLIPSQPCCCAFTSGIPGGIRTRVITVKEWRPGPLDDGNSVLHNLLISLVFQAQKQQGPLFRSPCSV